MQQKIIWFVLLLVSSSFSYYWFIIRDADAMAINELEYNDELLTGDVTQTTEVYARLEKKWIGSSKHIQNLEQKTDTLRFNLDEEIESTNDRFEKIRGDLEDYIRKQNQKNEDLNKTIAENHKDLKKSIQIVKRDIKKIENKRIKPLETEIKSVQNNREKLDKILELDMIIKALEKKAAQEAKNQE